MSTWTDDELGDLLRETFRDHEQPDDAEHAVRIARPAASFVRRAGVLPAIAAVAAGIVVVGGVAAVVRYGGQDGGASSASVGHAFVEGASTNPAPKSGGPVYRSIAEAEAQRLIATLPMPDSAKRTASASAPQLRGLGGPILAHPVTATGYWTVPDTTAETVAAHLLAHPSTGMTASTGVTRTHTSTTDWVVQTVTETARAGTVAYAPPEVDVAITQDGSDVAVRADAFLNWRSVRPPNSRVLGTVTSVEVATRASPTLDDMRPRIVRRTITDPDQARRLERLVDRLPGLAPWGPHGCFALTAPIGFASVTVHSDAGTWTFTERRDCSRAVTVTLDRRRVGTIDDTSFLGTVDAVMK